MASSRIAQATVLMSGGIDSAACAYFLQQSGLQVRALFVDYGQVAAKSEASASISLSKRISIPFEAHKLTNSAQTGAGELIGRNAMLIFNALFLTKGTVDLLAVGVHSGSNYFDCSEQFISSAGRLINELTDGRVSLVAPFAKWTKRDVFDYFCSTELPIELTYSCENGSDPVCGVCASCCDRKALGC